MSRWTLILLVLLVGGLGYLAWRQSARDRAYTQNATVALFPGLTEGDVTAVRLEVVERDVQARFERDPRFGWRMTDPVAVRAEATLLDAIVRAALMRAGTPVSEEELDPVRLGLSPPRMTLELESKDGVRHRVEFGALDLDGSRVNARVRGKVLRTLRDVETLLDADLQQFQSRSATTLDPRDIVEFKRSGNVRRPEDLVPRPMTLEAAIDGDRWRMSKPFDVLLDPAQMSLLCSAIAGLRFEGFVESGGASLAALGLDPPALAFELTDARGETQRLRFGQPDPRRPDRWLGLSDMDTSPWRPTDGLVFSLADDPIALVDHRFHRLPIAEIDHVTLTTPQTVTRLEKTMLGWTVSESRTGSNVFDEPVAADARKVTDFLGRVERTEFKLFVPDTAFDPAERRASIEFSARGTVARLQLGGEHATGGVRALRDPDALVGVVDDFVLELAQSRASAFWSDAIYDVDEVTLVKLALEHAGHVRAYGRDRTGVWVEKDRTSEARELRPVLDPLVFLRAARHLDSLAPPIPDPLVVRWTLSNELTETLTLGRVAIDGVDTVVCDRAGRRSVLAKPELLDQLTAIVDRR